MNDNTDNSSAYIGRKCKYYIVLSLYIRKIAPKHIAKDTDLWYTLIYGGVRSVDCARLYYIIRIMLLSVIKQLHNLIMQKERQRSQNKTDDVHEAIAECLCYYLFINYKNKYRSEETKNEKNNICCNGDISCFSACFMRHKRRFLS